MSFRRIVTTHQRKNEITTNRGWDGNQEENKLRRTGFGIKETEVRRRTSRRLWNQPMIIRSGDFFFFLDSRQYNETVLENIKTGSTIGI